jgi:hypothetical protein
MADKSPHKPTGTSGASEAVSAYSKRIQKLRKALPLAALLLLLILLFAANPDFMRTPPNAALTPDKDARLLIDSPVFEGRLDDGRRYRLQALQGGQQNNGDMKLTATQFDIEAGAGQTGISFMADAGLYRATQDNTMRLSGNIKIATGDGHELYTPRLEVDIAAASWLAAQGVTMTGPSGKLTATRLAADEASGLYVLENIKMRLTRAQNTQNESAGR